MDATWTKLTAFTDKHKGELMLNYFEVVRLDGLADIPDDDYCYVVSGEKGKHYISCVGRIFPLKGQLSDESYNEIERVFNLNIDRWLGED